MILKSYEFSLFGYKIKIEFLSSTYQQMQMIDRLAKTQRVFNSEPDNTDGLHRKITRIKAYRDLYQTGLIQAKEWVEENFPDNGKGELK